MVAATVGSASLFLQAGKNERTRPASAQPAFLSSSDYEAQLLRRASHLHRLLQLRTIQ